MCDSERLCVRVCACGGAGREGETSQHAGPSRITGLNCQSEEASVAVMTYFSPGHAGHDKEGGVRGGTKGEC